MADTILFIPPEKGKPTQPARAFCAAFIPNQSQTNITQAWSLRTSEAIKALIDFRSAIHRWLAVGYVSDAEFVAELERLEDAGLGVWAEELIALATLAFKGGER